MYRLSFALFALMLCFWPASLGGNTGRGFTASVNAEVGNCRDQAEIERQLTKLTLPLSEIQLTETKMSLRVMAGRSNNCRQEIIDATVTALGNADPDLFHNPTSANLWAHGTEILGDLKAVEALDFLVGHLELTDGMSVGMNHYPAVGAVIAIGPPSLARLGSLLKEASDPRLRRIAVFCIGEIGSRASLDVLSSALPFESERCVRHFLVFSIQALRNKSLPYRIAPENRAEWYSAFFCNEQVSGAKLSS